MSLLANNLRVNALREAFGIDTPNPEFSWSLASDQTCVLQTAYQVQVSNDDGFDEKSIVWDSGETASDKPFAVRYRGAGLLSKTRYYWRVAVWDQVRNRGPWSAISWFESGFFEPSDFHAQLILRSIAPGTKTKQDRTTLYFRRFINVPGSVIRGRLYATAHGWYKSYINMTNVTADAQVPRWTPHDRYTEYQTYDVTSLFHVGENVLGAIVSDGHFRGENLGFSSRNCYGDQLGYYARIELELEGGATMHFETNDSWQVGLGRIVRSDPKAGERIDLRIPQHEWLSKNSPVEPYNFQPVQVSKTPIERLIAEETERVGEISKIKPARVWVSPAGKQLVDFGQNFTGVVRVHLDGPRGTQVAFAYSEVLTKAGELNTDYIMPIGADEVARDEVTLSGTAEWFEPMFTLRGFRYVQIEGLPQPRVSDSLKIEAVVVSTKLDHTGTFSCSDERLEKLFRNTLWSMDSNFLSTPTDCPTRERAGWTGDIQVFSPTAMLMARVDSYLRRYVRNVAAEQYLRGSIPPYIPSGDSAYSGSRFLTRAFSSSVGWGDVSVLVPWHLYQYYGSTTVLECQYDSMKKWVDFLEERARNKQSWRRWFFGGSAKVEQYILDTGFHWGEWLRPGESGILDWIKGILLFPSAAVPTAYLAESSRLLSEIAGLIGKEDDASYYQSLSIKVRDAWVKSFVRQGGKRIAEDKQDDYVRAVNFNLIPKELQAAALERLAELVRHADYHLGTGFLSTRLLLPTLCDGGFSDEAFRVLLQTSPPSWLFPVERGSTTIWETWEGYNTKGDAYMSHNHYALGAVSGWLIEGIAGLSIASPGWRRIRVAPRLGGGLSYASGSVMTPFGRLTSLWKVSKERGVVELRVDIPAGTTAEIHLGSGVQEVGSGSHEFSWEVSD